MTIHKRTLEIHRQLGDLPKNLIEHLTFTLADASALTNMDQRTFKRYLRVLQNQSDKMAIGLRFNIRDIERIAMIARKGNECLTDNTQSQHSCSNTGNDVNSKLEDMLK